MKMPGLKMKTLSPSIIDDVRERERVLEQARLS